MLEIVVPRTELFDEQEETLEIVGPQTLQLEHSLISISKWESKWHVPFLEQKERSEEQLEYYIRCMTINKNVDPRIYRCLTNDNMLAINHYIEDPMTATTVRERDEKKGRQIITSELIYYWMIALEIPFECERWHLNRLLMLIRVCNIKNNPGKKMGRKELANYNKTLNASRRAKLGTAG